jgi:hypothetical protein
LFGRDATLTVIRYPCRGGRTRRRQPATSPGVRMVAARGSLVSARERVLIVRTLTGLATLEF